MSDVFLSYASGDRPRVRPLAEALKRHNWSIWWDPHLLPGQSFDRVIETELANTRCVVVVWSRASVESHWVLAEADKGMKRRIVVPVLIDPVDIPMPYSRLQAANLIGWSGALPNEEFENLVLAISQILRRSAPPDAPPPLADNAAKRKGISAHDQVKTIEVRVTLEGGGQLEIRFQPSRLHLRPGETVNFVCNQGTLDILLEPADAYTRSRFRTGDPPVQVTKRAKGTSWVGGTFHAAGPRAEAIAIDPSQRQFGAQIDSSLDAL